VTDKTVYVNTATFRVPSAAGYDYTATLNGAPVPTDADVTTPGADYYEVLVMRRNTSTNATDSQLVQFIVRSSERQNSEWGLPPWVPYPVIDSAAAEFVG